MAYEGWGAVGVGNVDKREALHGLKVSALCLIIHMHTHTQAHMASKGGRERERERKKTLPFSDLFEDCS